MEIECRISRIYGQGRTGHGVRITISRGSDTKPIKIWRIFKWRMY